MDPGLPPRPKRSAATRAAVALQQRPPLRRQATAGRTRLVSLLIAEPDEPSRAELQQPRAQIGVCMLAGLERAVAGGDLGKELVFDLVHT